VQSFVNLPSGGTAITISNAGEVESKGFEVELQWFPIDEFQLWASYGYTDATFTSYPEPGGPGTDFTGNRLADAPKFTYSLGAEYRETFNSGDFVVQGNYFSQDEFYSNPDNAAVNLNESRGESSARIGFESDSEAWNVYLWAKNLADDESQIHNTISFLGTARAQHAQPRTYGITVNYNF
jgi:iron complex outermembrane receptor protein